MIRPQLCLALCSLLCLLCTQFGSASHSELHPADSPYHNYLPDCNVAENNKLLNLFVVSTLDGKISVIDAVSGDLKWSKQITSGPLLSSSISDFMVNNKGEIVRIVPSLDGNLFVHNGRTIKQTQFSTEKLLKSSLKFSENVLLVGGQENRIIGLNLNDGSIAYECGFEGCSQTENLTLDNVVLFKKTLQSVRAINSLSGKEEWHFVVNDPQLMNVANQQCHGDQSGNSKYTVDFKVVVPSGFIHSSVYHYMDELAIKQFHKSWEIKFDSPIVNMWHYENGKLDQVNLFTQSVLDIESIKSSHPDQNLKDPDYYIGTYNNQLYIQRPALKEGNQLSYEENMPVDKLSEHNTAIIQVEWKKQPAAIGSSLNVTENFEISTKSTVPFLNFNKLNSTRYYIFKLNQSADSNKCERITDENEPVIIEDDSDDIINIIVYASLSYYWKEILVICLLSWVVLNFFTLLFKNYGLAYIKRFLWKKESTVETIVRPEEPEHKSKSGTESTATTATTNTNTSTNTVIHNSNIVEPHSNAVTYNSRYLQDFEQISLLGKGGFGLVFEAKHKIDEGHYAVKRVTIPAQTEKRERFMREIRALSKLNHNGIVRYFNAWIEEPPVGWQERQDQLADIEMTEGLFTEGYSVTTDNVDSMLSCELMRSKSRLNNKNRCRRDDTLEIVFMDDGDNNDQIDISSMNDEQEDSDDDDFNPPQNTTQTLSNDYDGSLDMAPSNMTSVHWDESVRSKPSCRGEGPKPIAKVYVYIQMQLCKKETLKDWLFENKERDKCEMLRIFTQLIDAVHYVHSNKLIHRDLKPSNIFFDMDGLVKIGDFGLATNTLDDHCCEVDTNQNKTLRKKLRKHTNDVGTQLYMSPEQVKNEPYDHKVDIYSMGIILYELLESFNTESERIKTLQGVRNKKFSNDFVERHKKECEVLRRLLSFKPKERPEAYDLLQEEIFRHSEGIKKVA